MSTAWQPLPRQSLADGVFAQLSGQILQGALEPGDELPAERILAEELGVNRGAVREGLKRLQQAGLVRVRHGGSTQIENWRDQAGPELLPQLIIGADGQPLVAVARDIMAMRSVLAPAIARAAAARQESAVIVELQDHLQTLASAATAAERQAAALAFWAALVAGCGNLAYRLSFNALRRSYVSIQGLLTQVLDVEFSDLEGLETLQQAIVDGDEDAAAAAALAHVRRGEKALNSVLTALEQGGRR